MKKFIVGFLCGALIFSAGLVAADGISLIGKKIQSEAVATLDGEQIDTAIIVDGKSYAPVRSVAEATGLTVGFEKGKVKLEKKTMEYSLDAWQRRVKDLTETVEGFQGIVANAEGKLDNAVKGLEKWQSKLDALIEEGAAEEYKLEYEQKIAENLAGQEVLKADLKEKQDKLAEYEAQLAEAKAKVAELS